MQAFTIEAKSLESARALYAALSQFYPELTGSEEEGFVVRIGLDSVDRGIVAVLDALEKHITERDDGPAHVEVGGHRYTMHSRVPA